MKKILKVLFVLALIVFALLAYQWHQASRRLQATAKGGTFRAFGLKLEVAPSEGGVRGWLKLTPYLDIPRVTLDLSAWGGLPYQLGKGRLSTPLWKRAGLLLVIEAGDMEVRQLSAQRLAFDLELPDVILGLSAKSLKFSEGYEELILSEPMLRFVPRGEIPQQLQFRIQAMDFRHALGGEAPTQEAHFGPLEIGYDSEVKGEDLRWHFSQRGEGGTFRDNENRGEILAWNSDQRGKMANLSSERWRALRAEWQEALESQPSPESMPFRSPLGVLEPLLQKFIADLIELRPQPETLTFHWEGMKLHSAKDPAKQIEVSPLEATLEYRDETDGMKSSFKSGMKHLQVAGEDKHFELSDLTLDQKSEYHGIHYPDWLRYNSQYYLQMFSSGMHPATPLEMLGNTLRPSLARMADTIQGEIRLGRIRFEAANTKVEHRDAVLGYEVGKDGVNYRFQDAFDWSSAEQPIWNIRQGKLDLRFGFPLPWNDLLQFARQTPESNPSSATAWPQLFAGKTVGLDWKWDVDLGEALFGLKLDLSIHGDVEKALHAETPPPAGLSLDQYESYFVMQALRRFLLDGSIHCTLHVERLSKFQATMDRIKSGASMGLGILAPYVVVDSKADTLQTELNFKDGELWINSKRYPALEDLLRNKSLLE